MQRENKKKDDIIYTVSHTLTPTGRHIDDREIYRHANKHIHTYSSKWVSYNDRQTYTHTQ